MDDLIAVYEAGDEDGRLLKERNGVEWERTCEVLRRWLPVAPGRILDVGGASGRYASWLTDRGYGVQVVDPVPGHVAQARARGLEAFEGDARDLGYPDGWADAVLLLGPLYHLPQASDRARALAEAARVCAPGGVVVAAAMSRWAKPAEYAARSLLSDGEAQRQMLRLLEQGHDADGNAFDQTSYNHDPGQLRAELVEAGLVDIEVIGVEGPLGSFARQDPQLNHAAVRAARASEYLAPHLSLHLLARGQVLGVATSSNQPGR
jgi:SAM-dependent methyltransferase